MDWFLCDRDLHHGRINRLMIPLTLQAPTPQTGQTHSNNSSATARFLYDRDLHHERDNRLMIPLIL